MHPHPGNFDTLKYILDNGHRPQLLDSHPWTKSLIVMRAVEGKPELLKKNPGQRLVLAIGELFADMMPANPPRRGKRLDTRWGEFGILAAQYFAPLMYGAPVPGSLREAWGQIDRSILIFASKKPIQDLSDVERDAYRLVGSELSIAPNSTLSDWHKKGLERLLELILRRENYLSETTSKPAAIHQDGQLPDRWTQGSKSQKRRINRPILIFLGILLLGLGIYDGVRIWKIYNQAMLVRQDVLQLQTLVSDPGSIHNQIRSAGPALSTLRQDFEALKDEAEPFLSIGPLLRWIPVYGGDLESIPSMVNMADHMLASADITLKAIEPIIAEYDTGISPTRLTEVLVQAQPQIIEADRRIVLAGEARRRIKTENLTPEVRNMIVNDLDPLIDLMGDGLSFAGDFPRLMGATGEGPKSYLVLAQNEDELRPTGGFITAVGTLLLDNGRISDLTFVNSYDLDDWSKPYPAAPWQLQQYMDTSVLVLRDTSWFTNYPTAALYAETLYSYTNGQTVDGVIAFDQQFLVEMLDAVGPIELAGVSYRVDSSNIISYMRTIKTPFAKDLHSDIDDASGMSKVIFIKEIADALMEKIINGEVPLERLITALLKVLNEHHLLLRIDSPSISNILSRNRWDGAVRPELGDFLMAVDTNVGFNKTNVMVQSNITYDVDLTNPDSPAGSLSIVHTNNAKAVICKQAGFKPNPPPGEEKYLVTDCYWNYLRVYMPGGAQLLDATPQFVPANWMIVKQDVAAHVDILDEEIEGVQTFGTLQVVPGSESLLTNFQVALPASIIQSDAGQFIYHLLVQKQPGTLAVPITIRVHLPTNAIINTTSPGAVIQRPNILFQANLQRDIEFEVVFQNP
jgi:hypothetical protein